MTPEQLAQDIVNRFKEKTWLDLFEASHTFYTYLLYYIDDMNQLVRYIKEDSASTYDTIMDLADYIVGKKELDKWKWKIIERAVNYSINNCTAWTRVKSDKYTVASEEMFPEEKIIESLMEHDMACFNPLMFHSDYNWWTRCIFRPAPSLCKRYWFIQREYYNWTRVTKDILINLEHLRAYDRIIIREWEIWPINYKLYHPILRSRIMNKDFWKFMLIS